MGGIRILMSRLEVRHTQPCTLRPLPGWMVTASNQAEHASCGCPRRIKNGEGQKKHIRACARAVFRPQFNRRHVCPPSLHLHIVPVSFFGAPLVLCDVIHSPSVITLIGPPNSSWQPRGWRRFSSWPAPSPRVGGGTCSPRCAYPHLRVCSQPRGQSAPPP